DMNYCQDMQIPQAARFALVVFERPKDQFGRLNEEQWQNFAHNVPSNTKTTGKTPTIHDNIWLTPLQTETPFLIRLCASALNYGIPIRILFLHDEPDWIKWPPDQSPTSALEASLPTS